MVIAEFYFHQYNHHRGPSAGALPATGMQPTTSINQWKLSVPSFILLNLGSGLTKGKTEAHFSHSLRLNVNNAFKLDYLKVSKIHGDDRGVCLACTPSFSARLGF